MNHNIKEKMLKNSFLLEKYGLADLAWNKTEAQNFILSIMNDQIGILGGDVYKLVVNHLEPLYDNWSCERKNNEKINDYYLRSKEESISYIMKYPVISEENIVFSITFTSD